MSFIRYKRRGNRYYVYEVTNQWDKSLKKYIQKNKYLGVSDSNGGEYSKPSVRKHKERTIVDFGNGYSIVEIAKRIGLLDFIKDNFEDHESIMSLVCYQILEGSAMYNCSDWCEGNIIGKLFPKSHVNSQDISRLLNHLGKDEVQREFFTNYISKFFSNESGVLIDSTSMPSSINIPINNYGYSSTGINEHINCLLLTDKNSQRPIYFRTISGDIPDVATLKHTFEEATRLGSNITEVVFDAGYFSEENIKYLCNKKVDFISRMPKSRKKFKQLIDALKKIKNKENAVYYNDRALFIETKRIILYKHQMYANIIFDPDKEAKDLKKILGYIKNNPEDNKYDDGDIERAGFLILISKNHIEKDNVMPTYYKRQEIEQVFGFAKENNNMLPLRVHSQSAVNGYMLIMFLAICIFVEFRKSLQNSISPQKALIMLRNVKAKIYDEEFIIQEINQKTKKIFKQLNITVPKSQGI